MGVIKRPFLNAGHTGIVQDTASETTETASVASVPSVVRVPRCRRRRRVRAEPVEDVTESDLEERASRLGARQARRLANMQFLLKLADKFGVSEDCDSPNSSSSLFAELLNDRDKMLFWQEFTSLNEERQRRLLENFSSTEAVVRQFPLQTISEDLAEAEEEARRSETSSLCESAGKSEEGNNDEYGFELVASVHSNNVARARFCDCETCYGRIESRFRALLRRRNVPRGLLDSLEQRLTAYFVDSPDAVYVMALETAYERLCAHIVSEWLGLHAQSMSGDFQSHLKGKRKRSARCTVVENLQRDFVPPEKCLVHYLDERDAKRTGSLQLED